MSIDHNDNLYWESKNFSKIPIKVFSDRNIYKREMERIFSGPVWLFLGLEAEIPNPGDFITNYAGEIPIVINRSIDNKIYAFVNRCAHRSATVVYQQECCIGIADHLFPHQFNKQVCFYKVATLLISLWTPLSCLTQR